MTVAGRDCRFHIFSKPRTPCDQARDFLTKAGVSYTHAPYDGSHEVVTTVVGQQLIGFDEAVVPRGAD